MDGVTVEPDPLCRPGQRGRHVSRAQYVSGQFVGDFKAQLGISLAPAAEADAARCVRRSRRAGAVRRTAEVDRQLRTGREAGRSGGEEKVEIMLIGAEADFAEHEALGALHGTGSGRPSRPRRAPLLRAGHHPVYHRSERPGWVQGVGLGGGGEDGTEQLRRGRFAQSPVGFLQVPPEVQVPQVVHAALLVIAEPPEPVAALRHQYVLPGFLSGGLGGGRAGAGRRSGRWSGRRRGRRRVRRVSAARPRSHELGGAGPRRRRARDLPSRSRGRR